MNSCRVLSKDVSVANGHTEKGRRVHALCSLGLGTFKTSSRDLRAIGIQLTKNEIARLTEIILRAAGHEFLTPPKDSGQARKDYWTQLACWMTPLNTLRSIHTRCRNSWLIPKKHLGQMAAALLRRAAVPRLPCRGRARANFPVAGLPFRRRTAACISP